MGASRDCSSTGRKKQKNGEEVRRKDFGSANEKWQVPGLRKWIMTEEGVTTRPPTNRIKLRCVQQTHPRAALPPFSFFFFSDQGDQVGVMIGVWVEVARVL